MWSLNSYTCSCSPMCRFSPIPHPSSLFLPHAHMNTHTSVDQVNENICRMFLCWIWELKENQWNKEWKQSNREKIFKEVRRGVNLSNKIIQGEMIVIFKYWRELIWKKDYTICNIDLCRWGSWRRSWEAFCLFQS